MRSVTVPIKFPVEMKRKLDALRTKGYTIAGFVRRAVERALESQK